MRGPAPPPSWTPPARKDAAVDSRPLILTLELDPAAQAAFDALRRAHFPPERNHLQAHVTLFHALPASEERRVRDDLAGVAARPPYDVEVVRVRSLGRGVAFDLHSPELAGQRAELAARWLPWLTAQDARWSTPHVTVANKVQPDVARALLAELRAGFVPYRVSATGLALWRYLGGPWEPLGSYRFSPKPTG